MWSNRGSSHDIIPLTDEDCHHLVNAGLTLPEGVHPRDRYCYHYLDEWYDGTPLQVLRLIEEVRGASGGNLQPSAPVPITTGSSSTPSKSTSPRPMESVELVMTMKVTKRASSSSADQAPDRNIQNAVTTPFKPAPACFQPPILVTEEILIDNDENDLMVPTPAPSSTRKRKTLSPTAYSPSRKARRTSSSVLQQFETPEPNRTVPTTPTTEPAAPRRSSMIETVSKPPFVEVADDDGADELVDNDQDSNACCAGTLEPMWDVLHRTSWHFQNVWEEVRELSPCLALLPMTNEEDVAMNVFADDPVPRTAHDVDLVYQGDEAPVSFVRGRASQNAIKWDELVAEGGEDSKRGPVRTRRQQQRRLSASTWRLW